MATKRENYARKMAIVPLPLSTTQTPNEKKLAALNTILVNPKLSKLAEVNDKLVKTVNAAPDSDLIQQYNKLMHDFVSLKAKFSSSLNPVQLESLLHPIDEEEKVISSTSLSDQGDKLTTALSELTTLLRAAITPPQQVERPKKKAQRTKRARVSPRELKGIDIVPDALTADAKVGTSFLQQLVPAVQVNDTDIATSFQPNDITTVNHEKDIEEEDGYWEKTPAFLKKPLPTSPPLASSSQLPTPEKADNITSALQPSQLGSPEAARKSKLQASMLRGPKLKKTTSATTVKPNNVQNVDRLFS